MSKSITEITGGVDLAVAVQGHVGPKTKQVFTTLRVGKVFDKRLSIEAGEFLFRDQFGNAYCQYQTMLSDGATYTVTDFIGKILSNSGEVKPIREFKHFWVFSDAMIDHLRSKAFVAFGRKVIEILKGKQAEGAAFVLSADEARAMADGVVSSVMAAGDGIKPPDTKVLDAPRSDDTVSRNQAILCPTSPPLTQLLPLPPTPPSPPTPLPSPTPLPA